MPYDQSFASADGFPADVFRGYTMENGFHSGDQHSRQPVSYAGSGADIMAYSAFAGPRDLVAQNSPTMASRAYGGFPVQQAQKQQLAGYTQGGLVYGPQGHNGGMVKSEYSDPYAGHYIASRNGGLDQDFSTFQGDYAANTGMDHSLGQYQTPLMPAAGFAHRGSDSSCFGSVGDDTMHVDEDDHADRAGVQLTPSSESPSRRKRGRPKTEGSKLVATKESMTNGERTRMPHNEVERKYRESLNVGFEKLRSSVPTLPENSPNAGANVQKQSKAAVLGAAIEYIKHLESETERLQDENSALKSGSSSSDEKPKRSGAKSKSGRNALSG